MQKFLVLFCFLNAGLFSVAQNFIPLWPEGKNAKYERNGLDRQYF